MVSDLFTKNLGRGAFEKCAKAYVGEDEYMKIQDVGTLKGESVGENKV